MTVTARRACSADISGICSIESATSASPWSRASIAHDVENDRDAYVAVLSCEPDAGGTGSCAIDTSNSTASRVIGYADMWIVAGEAQLNNIAVDEEYRGRGYGRMLLDHMIAAGRDLGCSVMTLEVRRGNAAAVSLYIKTGFVQTGIRPRYYRDNDEDAVLMDREI